MTIQGTAKAQATSVLLPAHAAGDLILLFAQRNSNAAPTTPAAGGTVPAWTIALGATGANAQSIKFAWAFATASDTTTGVWTNTGQLAVLILRPAAGKVLAVGPSSSGTAPTTQTIVYPALTLSTLGGTSWGVRCGSRGATDTEVANAPPAWTNQIIQNNQLAVHTRASLAANPTADTVNTTGTDANYRAYTIEVTETSLVTQQPMATII